MKVAGNMNPWPIADGTRKRKYAQSGIPRCMQDNATVPETKQITPRIKSHFSLFVQVIRNPVAVPTADAAKEGTINRKPDEVALSRSTA
jgi:hypothetical protein